ncbi:MAG: helix-turn-helix domain-containing protein [Cetobacterium sp.]|uniref:helix-turn-helix domain-containing protein n=1 Tax=Cetobacterium sp. TaxID=2071632 RepID=UPI002FC9A438
MEEINLGLKIKKFRIEKNLNLKELSEMIGSTSALLGQIEKGITNPSINTLKNIALALEIPLYKFFLGEDSKKSSIVRANERKIIKTPKEIGISYELLSPEPQTNIEFMLLTLEQNSKSSDKEIGHEGEEVAFILEGEVNLNLEGEIVTLYKGDSIKIDRLTKHSWENIQSEVAKVIFAITPPKF